ncbi:hypothetical protein TVAG_393060 [Trichomonas vaginalis G3]|uniref:Uncharacterized protein n=1 Tax=Trichomonas vaginalis (strain ATCC PRA-98 / G3) TaxID=412133 RepID=A2DYA2_TRIV3|nr:hypothetical protein TVAGG3_0281560 [Trichomonas vaginalis G3]EAY14579.1 hypothetical protein TVAG_393060 [Trichomonas vaginalis G3]KAI5526589.1 hypothetical protein TVAGG3_0281560 [Trichomonas vaginalis G3]|eukprot:XP_001326802.1 hypothetical protein [Trichomonas vaginalis G3]
MNIVVFAATFDKEVWAYQFYSMWFPMILPVIDEVLLYRHHITRGDFSMIEKPKDIKWMNEEATIYSIRLLSSLEEEEIAANVKEDLFTSIFCFIIFFIAVTIRVLLSPFGYFFKQ